MGGTGEDGIAAGWFLLLVFLILGAFSYMCITVLFNGVLEVANENIAENKTSEQTKNAVAFNRDICMYLPVLMLIGAFVWSIARGVGGSGVDFGAFYTGWIILVLCCMVGFLMAFLGGTVIDTLYGNLDSMGYIENPAKMTAVWATAQANSMYFFINLYYFLSYMMPVLGIAVFFKSTVKETSGSQYYRTGY